MSAGDRPSDLPDSAEIPRSPAIRDLPGASRPTPIADTTAGDATGPTPQAEDSTPASAPAAPVPLDEVSLDGPFRLPLVVLFHQSPERRAVEVLGEIIHKALALLPTSEPDPLQSRLRALVADLDFLAQFLGAHVDGRCGSSLDPEDWEPARTAGLISAQLAGWLDPLRAAIDEPPAALSPLTWEDVLGVRETALWRIASTPEADGVRRIGQMLFTAARDLPVSDSPPAEPPRLPQDPISGTRRDALAAAADLLNLAAFATATAKEAPKDQALHKLLETLSYRLAQAVETLCADLDQAPTH